MSLAKLLEARAGRPGSPEQERCSTAGSHVTAEGRPGRPGFQEGERKESTTVDAHSPTLADLAAALGDRFPIETDDSGQVMVDTRAVLSFADDDDIVDLVKPRALVAFAASLANDGKVGTWTEARAIERRKSPVRCIDCRHHRRTDHPHLVDCARGVESTNPTRLFWATDRRGCDQYEPATCMEPTP